MDIQNILDYFKMRELGFIDPKFDLNMCEIKYVDNYRMLSDINTGNADAAITEEENIHFFENCDFVVLGESTNTIVVSPDNKFAKEKSVSLEDIANEEFVFHIEKTYDEYVMKENIKDYCAKKGFDFRNISFAENYQTALIEVMKNKKIAISSNLSPTGERKEWVSIPIEDCKKKIVMVIRKDISEEKRKVAMSCYNKTE